MTKSRRRELAAGLIAIAATILCPAAGGVAFAQTAGTVHALPPPNPADARAGRADRLRAILQLRPSQEAGMQSYLAGLETVGRRMAALAGPVPATMPERAARMQRILAEGKSAMDIVADVTGRFYGALDAGQKAAFDALPMQAVMHGEKDSLGMAGGVLTSLDPLKPLPPR